MINPDIFKAYDIRGIYPTDINEETVSKIATAIFSFFTEALKKDGITIVLGRDMRLSSPQLFEVAKNRLLELGANVIDVGLVSTPTFYFAVHHFGYDSGIQITASHNPKEYNGMKFVLNSPQGLIKIGKTTGMPKIQELANTDFSSQKLSRGRLEKRENIISEEVSFALSFLGNPEIKPFTVVADTANAMGATYIEELFKKISGNLIKMNFELDGSFPAHQPDPLDYANLADLRKKVVETKADFGLAPDGDGDRVFFIDEKGEVVPASVITALIARELLIKNPGATILFDVRYVLTPKEIIETLGGKGQISKVGHAFITEGMRKAGGLFAGESSGHYFYRETGNAESQVITILIVLLVMSRTKKPLSELVTELSKSYESGEINFKVTNADAIIATIKDKYKDGEVSDIDGVTVDYPDWRLSLRSSNTEPLLRLNLEAKEKDVLSEKKLELIDLINTNGSLL